MQLTTQTRPTITPEAALVLARLVGHYGMQLRKLYAVVAAKGGKVKDHKTEFCKAHGITARYFNGLANDLQGSIDSVRELLKQNVKDRNAALKKLKKRVAGFDKKFADLDAKRIAVTTKVFRRWTAQQRKLQLKVKRLERKIAELQRRLKANVPGICFGSRKLFRKQFNLAENGYRNRAEWLADWRAARDHRCFFLGSGDETGGNQSCTLSVGEDGLLALRIRLPDAVIAAGKEKSECDGSPVEKPTGKDKYLVLGGLSFPYDEPALRWALREGKPLSWLIHKDHKGYRLMVSFARPAAPISTLSAKFGAIGIDFNADHLAVTETDPGGNMIQSWRVELPLEDKSTGQRAALLSDALEGVVEHALQAGKPIAAEDLDFTDKKKDMSTMSPAQARALSGLSYAKYQQLLASKCHRRGVELIKVNPAYTSLAGQIKYAKPRGLSVHKAAAGVIARRSQGYKECIPRLKSTPVSVKGVTVLFQLPARNRAEGGGTSWDELHVALGKFRRAIVAAQKKTSVARKVGTSRGKMPRGPSEGTVTPAGNKSSRSPDRGEQICSW
ncbi:IS200/IS605 family accessory protein TnpB-related protein [Cupriavidus necator]|nr:IS200/IS605 family accessory protein TnpB-related protein [Cupriavidus necator]QQX88473.1 IS200/IS605 family accessory protein TnpB-related protein [Cupriavidus necator]